MNNPFEHDFFSTNSPTTATFDNDIYYYDHEISSLSDRQEKIISILPIPSAILSVFGSVTIICMAYQTRRANAWSTYTRLLVAMSLNDILFSTSFSLNAFLLPAETSQRVWAFGTDATCSATGFFLQFSSSGILYNGMLSFYFLLTARFGVSKPTMARYIEPIMHFISVGYPFATALSGLILGVYHETELGQSCWVANYPENCGEAPGETGEPCQSTMLGYIFGAIVVGFTLLSLFFNNLAILVFVRKQMRPFKDDASCAESRRSWFSRPPLHSSMISPDEESTTVGPCEKNVSNSTTEGSSKHLVLEGEDDCPLDLGGEDSGFFSLAEEQARLKQDEALRKDQFERLQLVASQSYLYVAAFLLSTAWPTWIRILESLNYNKEDEDRLFVLLALQAWFFPFQGLLNLCVYARPRYLKYRKEFPKQSRLFAIRRSIHGDKVQPKPEPYSSARSASHSRSAHARNNKRPSTAGAPKRAADNGGDVTLQVAALAPSATVLTSQAGYSTDSKANATAPQQQQQQHACSVESLDAAGPLEAVQENTASESSTAKKTINTDGEEEKEPDVLAFARKLPRNMVSSLTASQGDFSIIEDPVEALFAEHERTALASAGNSQTTSPQWWSGAASSRSRRRSGGLPLLSSITASIGDFSIGEDEEDTEDNGGFWRQDPNSTGSSGTSEPIDAEAPVVPKRRGSEFLVGIPEEEHVTTDDDSSSLEPSADSMIHEKPLARKAEEQKEEPPTLPTRRDSQRLVGIPEMEGLVAVDAEAPVPPVRRDSRNMGTRVEGEGLVNEEEEVKHATPHGPFAGTPSPNEAPVPPVRLGSERLIGIPEEGSQAGTEDATPPSQLMQNQKDTPLQPARRIQSPRQSRRSTQDLIESGGLSSRDDSTICIEDSEELSLSSSGRLNPAFDRMNDMVCDTRTPPSGDVSSIAMPTRRQSHSTIGV
mmetsp:Transcript_117519/g.175521  ORF Transcript_117519/g.175521 Transcript_117519/m.175521 type:complete len:941 (-) Transcript_117519:48-2870(-)